MAERPAQAPSGSGPSVSAQAESGRSWAARAGRGELEWCRVVYHPPPVVFDVDYGADLGPIHGDTQRAEAGVLDASRGLEVWC